MMTPAKRTYPEFTLKSANETEAVVNAFVDAYKQVEGNGTAHSPLECMSFYEIARGLHNEPNERGDILHAGVCRGSSLCSMGLGLKHSAYSDDYIIGIDRYWNINDNYNDNNFLIAKRNVDRFDIADRVFLIVCQDQDYFRKYLLPDSARVIFLDTTHDYEQTKLELDLSLPFLIPNGWIVLHDYHENHPGTIQAVHELIDAHPSCSAYLIGDGAIAIQKK